MKIGCPVCGSIFDLIQAMEDADARQWVTLLTELPPTVIKPLVRYLYLFRPPRQAMRWSRLRKLTAELAPLIRAAEVQRNGISYVVPAEVWVNTLTSLVDHPPSTLRLPLKSNGYLLSVLAGQAEQAAARNEKQAEERKRHQARERSDTGPTAIGDLVAEPPPRKGSPPPPDWKRKALGGNRDRD